MYQSEHLNFITNSILGRTLRKLLNTKIKMMNISLMPIALHMLFPHPILTHQMQKLG